MIINEMQSKLAMWSKQEQIKRFNRLLRLIVNPEWLMHATEITLASDGAKTPITELWIFTTIGESTNH